MEITEVALGGKGIHPANAARALSTRPSQAKAIRELMSGPSSQILVKRCATTVRISNQATVQVWRKDLICTTHWWKTLPAYKTEKHKVHSTMYIVDVRWLIDQFFFVHWGWPKYPYPRYYHLRQVHLHHEKETKKVVSTAPSLQVHLYHEKPTGSYMIHGFLTLALP